MEGDDVTLVCVTTSQLQDNVTWYRDGVSVANGLSLSINNVHRNDSDIYQCSVKFQALVAFSEIFIFDVSCK